MLIDAGKNEKGADVVEYLKEEGIDRLDILVGTHPDSDHIGGLDDVLEAVRWIPFICLRRKKVQKLMMK